MNSNETYNGVPVRHLVDTQNGLTDIRSIRRWTRRKYNELRESGYYSGHCSHAASEALNQASAHFQFGAGADGWCDECGREGWSYINTGDSYDTTILFSSESERFVISCVGDVLESLESEAE